MLRNLLAIRSTLLIEQVCPLCRRVSDGTTAGPCLCSQCCSALALPRHGCRGNQPLPWWSLGTYSGDFRHCLLRLKRAGSGRILTALLNGLQPLLPSCSTGWLVPIPSWKRRRANPLPAQIAAGLGRVKPHLLQRTRAGVGQHRLNRQQRLVNLQGAFQSPASAEALELWLVDDILTTGATALAAREALTTAGHRVRGLICLARTPAQGNGR